MTTLVGDELFEYLGNLDKQFERLESTSHFDSLNKYAHSQMGQIIQAETAFLRKYHSANGNTPSLSFNGNGLPYLESLVADVSSIREIEDEEHEFIELRENYTDNIGKINDGKTIFYDRVTKEVFNQKKEQMSEKIHPKRKVCLADSSDKGLGLIVREDFHVNGIDEFSQRIPVLSRIGKFNYQIAFNQLFFKLDEEFWALDREKVLGGKSLVVPEEKGLASRVYDDGLKLTVDGACKSVAESIKWGVWGIKYGLESAFIAPTRFMKNKDIHKLDSVDALFPTFIPWLFLSTLGTAAFTKFVLDQPGLYGLAAAGATNIISLFYEIGRYQMNKRKQLENKSKGNEE